MNTLVGLVTYQLDLRRKRSSCTSSSNGSSRKRKLNNNNNNKDDGTQAAAASHALKQGDDDTASGVVGYILHDETCMERRHFLLSVPQYLMRHICRAVKFHWTVKIHRYTLHSLTDPTTNNCPLSGFVEVHRDGLELVTTAAAEGEWNHSHPSSQQPMMVPFSSSLREQENTQEEEDIFTLLEIQRLEALDKKIGVSLPSTKLRYSLQANVQAVSPILTFDPAESFSLLELYDDDSAGSSSSSSSVRSCVAVLRKEALVMHMGIAVGQRIVLKQVRRQKWGVPKSLQMEDQNSCSSSGASGGWSAAAVALRVPSYVFVIENTSQIDWPHSSAPRGGTSSSTRHYSNDDILFHQPRYPLTTVSGEISCIHKIKVGKEEHLHSIDLHSCSSSQQQQQQSTITLFVTYFPMSTTLLLALRPGASIRATNVHRVTATGGSFYCACLRSNLILLSHASEDHYNNKKKPPENGKNDDSPLCIDLGNIHACAFLRIRRSYFEFCVRRSVMVWLEDFIAAPRMGDCSDEPGMIPPPNLDELTRAFLHHLRLLYQKEKCFVKFLQQKQSSQQRGAYAEFFDHDLDCKQNVETCGCQLSLLEHAASTIPPNSRRVLPMSLGQIHAASIGLLESTLDNLMHSSNCSIGYTGSVHRCGYDLIASRIPDSFSEVDDISPVLFGITSLSRSSHRGQSHGLVSNGCFAIPAIFSSSDDVVGGSSSSSATTHFFVTAEVRSVILSFRCIGIVNSHSSSQRSTPGHLPPFEMDRAFGAAVGPCVILVQQNRVFLASLRLDCTGLCVVGSEQNISNKKLASDERCVESIQSCLDGTNLRLTRNDRCFTGLLTHKIFKSFNIKKGVYTGFTLSLAHVDSQANSVKVEDVSTLQSINAKLIVPVNDRKRLALRLSLSNIVNFSLAEEHLTVAYIWWQVACSDSTAPLLDGGWDELASGASFGAQSSVILVRVPRSAAAEEERGYVRFSCRLEELSFCSVRLQISSSNPSFVSSTSPVDFVGRKRVFPGELLGVRQQRRIRSIDKQTIYAFGERLIRPISAHSGGVPTCSIADIFASMCADLRTKSRAHLAPSLVREIRQAKFLRVSYCQVTAQCSNCFQALVAPKNGPKSNNAIGATSYLNRPLSINGHRHVTNNNQINDHARETCLRCPNSCGSSFVSVKWECSGILDDGTGQAKLYAERDAALLLLGMSKTVARDVEAGALQNPQGVVYSKGFPPRQELAAALDDARNRAELLQQQQHLQQAPPQRRGHRHRTSCRPLQEHDILRFLTPPLRAEFYLQRHCRFSREPLRNNLVYYVRCKPLSDELRDGGLIQTKIEVVAGVTAGQQQTTSKHVASYTLPPLKLTLVDVAADDGDEFSSQIVIS